MPTWKPPHRGDSSETWTWVANSPDGRVLATVRREDGGWVADSKSGVRIGWAPNRREATRLVALDPLTGFAVPTEAHRARVGDASRATYIRALGFEPEGEHAGPEERYAGTTGELRSWAREKKTAAELDADIEAALHADAIQRVPSAKTSRERPERRVAEGRKPIARRGMITEGLARELPRFEFIAHWLETVTKKKENRGPLGLSVKRRGKRWQIVSPVGGGTVTFETTDPALLFDHARRGQLGPAIRDAEEFRVLAHQRAESERG